MFRQRIPASKDTRCSKIGENVRSGSPREKLRPCKEIHTNYAMDNVEKHRNFFSKHLIPVMVLSLAGIIVVLVLLVRML